MSYPPSFFVTHLLRKYPFLSFLLLPKSRRLSLPMDAAPKLSDRRGLLPALIRYKLHLISAAAFLFVAGPAFYAAPNFVSVLSYFWPLLLSTALFLAAIVFFGRASPADLGPGAAGGDIMDYVAGGGTNEMEPTVGDGGAGNSPPPSSTRQEQPTQG